MNALEAFNRALFLRINGGDDTAPWLIHAAIGIAEYLIYLIPALLLALWLWGDSARRRLALKACAVALVGIGVNQVIPLFWQHPRPFMVGLGHTWIPHAPDSSFPSDHMTVFASIGLSLVLDGAVGIGLVTLLVGACVAWARVLLGVHFPLDMVGAVGVAACSDVVVSPFWRRAGTTTTAVAERLYRRVFARPVAAGWIRR